MADQWVVTHDPYVLLFGENKLYVDLGAETMLAAEKGGRAIAVEIKALTGSSALTELERALGQHILYRFVMGRSDPGRTP